MSTADVDGAGGDDGDGAARAVVDGASDSLRDASDLDTPHSAGGVSTDTREGGGSRQTVEMGDDDDDDDDNNNNNNEEKASTGAWGTSATEAATHERATLSTAAETGTLSTDARRVPEAPRSTFEELLAKRASLGLASSPVAASRSNAPFSDAGSPLPMRSFSGDGGAASAAGSDASAQAAADGGGGSAPGHTRQYSDAQAHVLELLNQQLLSFTDETITEEPSVVAAAVGAADSARSGGPGAKVRRLTLQ